MYVVMPVSERFRPTTKGFKMDKVLKVSMIAGFAWMGLVLCSFVAAIVARDMGADFETVNTIARFFTFN